MAYLKADEILTRIRELAQDGLGSYRAISSSRFSGELHDGVTEAHQSRLGVLAQKPCEASIVGVRKHPQRVSIVGSVQIVLLDIEVRVIRTVAIDGQVDDSIRDDVKALAAQDADALMQVLEWPGNLATTSGGSTTDLQGMSHESSRCTLRGKVGAAMRLDTIHRFTGTALSRPATS